LIDETEAHLRGGDQLAEQLRDCELYTEETTALEAAGVVRQLIIGARGDKLKWRQTFGVWGEKTKRAVNRGLLKVPCSAGSPTP
jgi:hypothetical protein